MHDTSSFLVTVCDEEAVTKIMQEVHEIDKRWQGVQRTLADQSVLRYNAGIQNISQWCDGVESELSRHVRADYDDLNAHSNLLEVSLIRLPIHLYNSVMEWNEFLTFCVWSRAAEHTRGVIHTTGNFFQLFAVSSVIRNLVFPFPRGGWLFMLKLINTILHYIHEIAHFVVFIIVSETVFWVIRW